MANPAFAQDDLITNINDLPALSSETAQVQNERLRNTDNSADSGEGKQIVILYNQEGDNNIKDLELRKSDFTNGESLSGKIDVLKTNPSSNSDQLIEEIGQKDTVAAVDYDDIATVLEVPNDKHYSLQYYYPMINADKTWERAGDNEIDVAVLDTGLDTNHEDLQGRFLLNGKSFYSAEMKDVEGHGTEVSGVLAATTNNEIGIAGISGISPVSVVPYQVLGPDGSGRTSLIAEALNIVAESDQRVINMSLGVPSDNKVMKAAVDKAVGAGKIIISATGNDGKDQVYYPAAYDNVIGVGAVNSEYKRCTSDDWGEGNGSTYGAGIDCVAPGDMIATTSADEENHYAYNAGTSFSTPIVSGAVAQILTINPNLSFDQIKEILYKTSQDLGEAGFDLEYGCGLINIEAALNEVDNMKNNPAVSLSAESLELMVGGSAQLGYSTTSDSPFYWESSDPNIASVSDDGTVTAISNGNAVISIISEDDPNLKAECPVTVTKTGLTISAYSEEIGWMPTVNELGIAGTTGRHLNLEAFRLMTDDPDLSIVSTVHVQYIGDMVPVGELSDVGTTGQDKGIEAVKLDLTGAHAPYYDLYYRVYIGDQGWTPYAKSGEWAGTKGCGQQIEAIELFLPTSGKFPPDKKADVDWTFKEK